MLSAANKPFMLIVIMLEVVMLIVVAPQSLAPVTNELAYNAAVFIALAL
jgi:hypothetical protein